METAARSFPAPWRFEECQGGYRVLDASGQALTYVYADGDQNQKSGLTPSEAWHIARVIAQMPTLISSGSMPSPIKHGRQI